MEKKSSKDGTPQVFGGLAKADSAAITAWHRESLTPPFPRPPLPMPIRRRRGRGLLASGGAVEAGGDAGGMVTSLLGGADFAELKNNCGTPSCTGIANAASFGTHM